MNTDKVIQELRQRQDRVTEEDARNLVNDEKKHTIAQQKADKKGLLQKVNLLWGFLSDSLSGQYKDYSWVSISLVTASLLYLISPFDLIPDFIPGAGLIDDAFAIGFVLKSLDDELKKYDNWRENKPIGIISNNFCE